MPDDRWFDFLQKSLEENGLLNYHAPIAVHDRITMYPFGPYFDTVDADWHFRTCLRFETLEAAARPLFAMTDGSIFFLPGTASRPGTVLLTRGDCLGFGLARAIGMLPSWFPSPAYMLYENINQDDARRAAVLALGSKRAKLVVERLKKDSPQFVVNPTVALADQLADLWIGGQLPGGLFVEAGEQIGTFGPDATAQGFFTELRMVEHLDPPPSLFHNPSYSLALWEEMGWMQDLGSPPNLGPLQGLIDTSGPPSGNGTLTTVSGGGSSLISDKVASAGAGDTILILDALTYQDTVVIDRSINLLGAGTKSAKADSPDYPILDGQKDDQTLGHRPITISGAGDGIAYVGKLIIQNGRTTSERADGGGILVERNQAVISSCVVRNCQATGSGIFGEGFGGGIACYHASPAILGCLIQGNSANSRGKGIGLFGYGWPTIVDTEIRANTSVNLGSNPRHDGGGIGIQIAVTRKENEAEVAEIVFLGSLSDAFHQTSLGQARAKYVRICRTTIVNNYANDDGGGVYITCASRVILRHTDILFNNANSNGGGIRATFGSEVSLKHCKLLGNESQADLHSLVNGKEKKAGGGGIAARNADRVELVNTELTVNVANGWAGGGLSFVSTDEGSFAFDWLLGYDWNDFLFDPLVYNHTEAELIIDAQSSLSLNRATKLDEQTEDHGKGGGLYALRFVGERESGLKPPPGHGNSNDEMEAWPAKIYVLSANVLEPSNTASFMKLVDPQTVKHTNRLYVQNLVDGKEFFDEDLTEDLITISL